MIRECPALRIVFMLSFCFAPFALAAQPTLPDIAGVADSGIVTLKWNCQYSGLKSVSVLRSKDSINYAEIGRVKKLDKGVQTFADEKPLAGNNFYKLTVLFPSGLKWGSNYCRVYVKRNGADTNPDTVKTVPEVVSIVTATKSDPIMQVDTPVYTAKPRFKKYQVRKANNDTMPAINSPAAISTGHTNSRGDIEDPTAYFTHRKKLVFSTYEVDSIDETTLLLPRFIYTDPITGNVIIDMPDDVTTNHYSLRFYNLQGKMLYNIPRIKAASIILDKRNFQRKGTYKFVIRTDIVEFERGYVIVDPTP